MGVMMKIVETGPERIEALRRERLQRLDRFQDLYSEFLATGLLGPIKVYNVETEGRIAGYAIVSENDILYEFFVIPEYGFQSDELFNLVLNELNLMGAMVQTFDAAILNPVLRLGWPYRVVGCLYRDFAAVPAVPLDGSLTVRVAGPEDLPLLSMQDDEVFDPRERLAREVESGSVFLFYRGSELAGCGFMTRIHDPFPNVDLGVWTHPDYRHRGVAKRIIAYLRNLSLERGLFPQCGCDVNNLPSRKTLAGCGFVSRYSLLEFTRPNSGDNSPKQ